VLILKDGKIANEQISSENIEKYTKR